MRRDNETWLRALRSGGPGQQAALSDLREMLLGGLRRSLSAHASADDSFLDDMVQDALLRVLDRLEQFEGRSRFATWATSIAIRVAMSELRRRRWRDVSLDELVASQREFPLPVEDGVPAHAELDRQEVLDAMYEVIQNGLTEKQRTALLAELKGMPMGRVAEQLGSTRNAVYKLTHDARKRLKRGLEAAGFGANDIRRAFST